LVSGPTALYKSIGHILDHFPHAQLVQPCGWDAGFAVVSTGELAADGGGGVGIVAEVGGFKDGVANGVANVPVSETAGKRASGSLPVAEGIWKVNSQGPHDYE